MVCALEPPVAAPASPALSACRRHTRDPPSTLVPPAVRTHKLTSSSAQQASTRRGSCRARSSPASTRQLARRRPALRASQPPSGAVRKRSVPARTSSRVSAPPSVRWYACEIPAESIGGQLAGSGSPALERESLRRRGGHQSRMRPPVMCLPLDLMMDASLTKALSLWMGLGAVQACSSSGTSQLMARPPPGHTIPAAPVSMTWR